MKQLCGVHEQLEHVDRAGKRKGCQDIYACLPNFGKKVIYRQRERILCLFSKSISLWSSWKSFKGNKMSFVDKEMNFFIHYYLVYSCLNKLLVMHVTPAL